jgi:hypothetical protein
MQRKKLGEVPSFVNDWRARRDSNSTNGLLVSEMWPSTGCLLSEMPSEKFLYQRLRLFFVAASLCSIALPAPSSRIRVNRASSKA